MGAKSGMDGILPGEHEYGGLGDALESLFKGGNSFKDSDTLKHYQDPYHGLSEEERKKLSRSAWGDTLMQSGFGMLSRGYSAMPRSPLQGLGEAGLMAMSSHPKHLGNASLKMRRRGEIGLPSQPLQSNQIPHMDAMAQGSPPIDQQPGVPAAASNSFLDILYPNQKPPWMP